MGQHKKRLKRKKQQRYYTPEAYLAQEAVANLI
jgi:hypothetical protein